MAQAVIQLTPFLCLQCEVFVGAGYKDHKTHRPIVWCFDPERNATLVTWLETHPNDAYRIGMAIEQKIWVKTLRSTGLLASVSSEQLKSLVANTKRMYATERTLVYNAFHLREAKTAEDRLRVCECINFALNELPEFKQVLEESDFVQRMDERMRRYRGEHVPRHFSNPRPPMITPSFKRLKTGMDDAMHRVPAGAPLHCVDVNPYLTV